MFVVVECSFLTFVTDRVVWHRGLPTRTEVLPESTPKPILFPRDLSLNNENGEKRTDLGLSLRHESTLFQLWVYRHSGPFTCLPLQSSRTSHLFHDEKV